MPSAQLVGVLCGAGKVARFTGGSGGLGAAIVCFLAGSDVGYISGGVVDVAGGFPI